MQGSRYGQESPQGGGRWDASSPFGGPHGGEEGISSVVGRYERLGFGGQFGSRPGGQVKCFSCREKWPAARIQVKALHRHEGTSNPDSQAAVAAVSCPGCGTKGTLVLSYGPAGSPEDKLVLKELSDARSVGPLHPGL